MSSKSYFNEVGEQWDTMRQSFFSDSVRDKAIAKAGVQPGETAADFGAGSGFVSESLLDKGLSVIALDQSETMLKVMRHKFAHIDSFQCFQGDAEKVPIADTSVDYVFANMYLHHVEAPAKAIKEMVRILKPGGKLIITDLDEHEFEILRTEHHDRWMGFKREDIKSWFAEAGLIEAAIDCANESCRCDDNRAAISIFLAIGKKGHK